MIDIETFNNAVGNILKKRREDLGVGIIKYSSMVNISHSFVNKVEKGRSKISLYELFKYCEKLNVSPSDVVKEIEETI